MGKITNIFIAFGTVRGVTENETREETQKF